MFWPFAFVICFDYLRFCFVLVMKFSMNFATLIMLRDNWAKERKKDKTKQKRKTNGRNIQLDTFRYWRKGANLWVNKIINHFDLG